MREIVFDTETTGLEPKQGHRIVEIGCVEIINKIKTGKVFHSYINPQRDIPKGALQIHGITNEFLAEKPVFKKIAKDFLSFIGNANLIIHNASFDMKFINSELEKAMFPVLKFDRVIDTLSIARIKFPGAKVSLDALCERFHISLAKRDKHGALLDAELLAEVYVELTGGLQNFMFGEETKKQTVRKTSTTAKNISYEHRNFPLSSEEKNNHKEFILKKVKNSLWDYAT